MTVATADELISDRLFDVAKRDPARELICDPIHGASLTRGPPSRSNGSPMD